MSKLPNFQTRALTSAPAVKALLRKHNLSPNKRLGQNFLIDKAVLHKLVNAAEITKNDAVLEVGAGVGTITLELAKRAKRVIAVEKDRALIPILEETIKGFENVIIIAGDILKIKKLEIVWKLKIKNWKLVGNIPYYLTAPLIREFLERENPPKTMTLMVQKEMAQRICAKPPDMSILSVSVQVYSKPKIISYVRRSSFWPTPAVDSAILEVSSIKYQVFSTLSEREEFFTIVKAGFSSPRKQLANNLSKKLSISKEKVEKTLFEIGIDSKRRAETLSVEEWLKLTKYITQNT